MTVKDVEDIIRPLGLAARKAKNIIELSSKLVQNFDGVVPNTYKDLESLPGVGHKTASVIMAQAFGEPALPVDTHIHRLALRWGFTRNESNPDIVQQDLCRIFPRDDWNRVHLQLLYFGREYCTAKNHAAKDCPICSWINSNNTCADFSSPSSTELMSFVPKKKVAGVVYYAERVEELNQLKEHLEHKNKRKRVTP
jgi:endonuclease III